MKEICFKLFVGVVLLFTSSTNLPAQQLTNIEKILDQNYNLIPKHSNDTQYYEMESRLQKHASDGTIQGIDIYRLYLRCTPSSNSSKGDEYTCLKFTVQQNNSKAVSIPALSNWKYLFSLESKNDSSKGQFFDVELSKFENLKDENGKVLPIENSYHIYNAFVDFHTMSVFAEKTRKDSGVQDLKHVGDKIVHAAAFSQPPVHLGAQVLEGSYFKNGKITLEFKGLGLKNNNTCAILEYDSGESSFYMAMKPMTNMDVNTKGSSHYWGDIYKDLTTGWIQKAVLHELVISETIVTGMSNKIPSVIERTINIENVKQISF